MTKALKLYRDLLKRFGPPGPWPWFDNEPAHSKAEIIIGAILVQRTNWRNAAMAVANLRKAGKSSLLAICRARAETIKRLIRPAGVYRQKAQRLKTVALFLNQGKATREKLLELKGVGEETADTILLYAYNRATFIIDAYTRRFVTYFHLTKKHDYQSLKTFFETRLPKNVKLYQNYHALIIQWGKNNHGQSKED